MTLPTIITAQGLQPQTPASLRAQIVALVNSTNPGYTDNLPGSLIEDICSTDVASLVLSDQFRVDIINSVSPYGSNPFLLNQQGIMYGVVPGAASNTSVNVIFFGPPGFVIPQGFVVSDGTFQYVVQDGGVIQGNGQSPQLFCVATLSGTWDVPSGTVVNLVTSTPLGISLTVTNPTAGTPATEAESESEYRTRVLDAGLAVCQGMPSMLKTLLGNIAGVQMRLIAIKQQSPGWEIIVGGGDPYSVGYAIYRAVGDISSLVGSNMSVAGITNAAPGVVTTAMNHGYTSGQVCKIAGAIGMTEINNQPLIATVIDEKRFSCGLDTTSFGVYGGGGVLTPNLRNTTVSINDYPDVYNVPFVLPPQQSVNISLTWNTSLANFTQSAAVAQLGIPALVAYVNGITVGQPMNLFELQSAFQAAIANVLPPNMLTRMVFSVSINNVGVSPESGTGIIAGDPESYFETDSTMISINQG